MKVMVPVVFCNKSIPSYCLMTLKSPGRWRRDEDKLLPRHEGVTGPCQTICHERESPFHFLGLTNAQNKQCARYISGHHYRQWTIQISKKMANKKHKLKLLKSIKKILYSSNSLRETEIHPYTIMFAQEGLIYFTVLS